MSLIIGKMGRRPVYLTIAEDFKPGDMPPTGYLDWHAWAEVQHKAGLRQKRCVGCSRWKYPQELSDKEIISRPYTKAGIQVEFRDPVCLECAAKSKGGG